MAQLIRSMDKVSSDKIESFLTSAKKNADKIKACQKQKNEIDSVISSLEEEQAFLIEEASNSLQMKNDRYSSELLALINGRVYIERHGANQYIFYLEVDEETKSVEFKTADVYFQYLNSGNLSRR